MHAVRIGQDGNVGPVVDNEQRAAAARQLPQHPSTLDQIAVRQPLVPQLQHVDAGLDQDLNQLRKAVGRIAPVQQDVQSSVLQQFGSLPHAPASVHGLEAASATGGSPAVQAVARRNSSPTAGVLNAFTSWPRTLWKTRPWP